MTAQDPNSPDCALPGLPATPDRSSAVEQAIDLALASPATPLISPGFAERVALLAVQQPQPSRVRSLGWGPLLALLSGLLLIIGLFAVAPHTLPTLTDPHFDVELILLAELGSLLLFAPKLLSRR